MDATKSKRVFWMADLAMALNSVIVLLGMGWAWLTGAGTLAGGLVVLWGLALGIWLGWRAR